MQRPQFASKKEYGRRFTDPLYWRPYVEAVCERHGLGPIERMRAGFPGSHPVFIVEAGPGARYPSFVVKFYNDMFGGAESYPLELDIYSLVAETQALPAPALLTHGSLFAPGNGWNWPYSVTSLIRGISLGEAASEVRYQDRLALAAFLGAALHRLHSLPLERLRSLRPAWDTYAAFMEQQRAICVSNHTRWASLPAHLIAQLDSYLPPADQLIDRTSAPMLIHADLNQDHVLGYVEDGRWVPSGIIDFGDAMAADLWYELAALHLGLFLYDKAQLRIFLESYGLELPPGAEFARRAMYAALLHQFNVLSDFATALPGALEAASLDELAQRIWHIA
jgi:Ser/Thr protein kinase RdoA (MazF antagonist)